MKGHGKVRSAMRSIKVHLVGGEIIEVKGLFLREDIEKIGVRGFYNLEKGHYYPPHLILRIDFMVKGKWLEEGS